MNRFNNVNAWLVACSLIVSVVAMAGEAIENKWQIGDPILSPGLKDSFDEVAVKDPSIVFFEGMWHLFYTARSKTEGYHRLRVRKGTGRPAIGTET